MSFLTARWRARSGERRSCGRNRAWKRAVAVALIFLAAPACAQDPVADFYRGKTVKILIGFGPGGSSSFYAEILARFMGRHVPGNPSFVAQHMPGAGGVVVANHIAQRALRDGTEFAIAARTFAFEPQLGNRNALFDPLKLTWIGNANVENSTCISWHTTPIVTAKDFFEREFIVGGTGGESLATSIPRALNRMAGARFKVITGYTVSGDIMLAMERGELQGFCSIGWTFLKLRKPEWLAQRKIRVLFQMAFEKHPDIPEVPLVQDLVKTPEDRQTLDYMLAPQEMGRPFFAPPDVPRERADALRAAFMKTMVDPDFLREAERAGVEVQPTSGQAVRDLVARAYATPADIVKRASALLQE